MAQNHFHDGPYRHIQFGVQIKYTVHSVHNICYLKYYKASLFCILMKILRQCLPRFAHLFSLCFPFWCITLRKFVYKQQRTSKKSLRGKNNSIRLNFLHVSSWAQNSLPLLNFNFLRIFSFIEYAPRVFLSPFASGHRVSVCVCVSSLGATRCVTL